MTGTTAEFSVYGLEVGQDIPVRLWSPSGASMRSELPLLIANDGPEYDEFSGLTAFCERVIDWNIVPPHRVALIEPVMGERHEWYGASAAYSNDLVRTVLPIVQAEVPTSSVVGMGASLGALAMLAAHHWHPGTFDGLFLQSGSFHRRGIEEKTNTYDQLNRVMDLVADVSRAAKSKNPIPITITCALEENIACNAAMVTALRNRGFPVTSEFVGGGHNFKSWGDAFIPHLARLLRASWVVPRLSAKGVLA